MNISIRERWEARRKTCQRLNQFPVSVKRMSLGGEYGSDSGQVENLILNILLYSLLPSCQGIFSAFKQATLIQVVEGTILQIPG